MKKYYVNNHAQNNGDHEVHEDGCKEMKTNGSYKNIGYHYTCQSAVAEAKKTYPKADGCFFCSPTCHKS